MQLKISDLRPLITNVAFNGGGCQKGHPMVSLFLSLKRNSDYTLITKILRNCLFNWFNLKEPYY